jgi:SAM-dependent methyltransferase
MRRLSFNEEFDVILSLFTSFGYFEDRNDDKLVLSGIERALKPGGFFFLDIVNADVIKKRFEKGEKKGKFYFLSHRTILSTGLPMTINEFFSPRNKKWILQRVWHINGKRKIHMASINLYTSESIKGLLRDKGFLIKQVWSGYDGKKGGSNSQRLLVLAKKLAHD